jgi:ABC-type dipeptide/oligopeptide/nickel transport system ATPase subunit
MKEPDEQGGGSVWVTERVGVHRQLLRRVSIRHTGGKRTRVYVSMALYTS